MLTFWGWSCSYKNGALLAKFQPGVLNPFVLICGCLLYMYIICPFKMAEYWPNFFCEFMDLYSTSVHKHAKNKILANIQPYHMATVALWAGKMNHGYPSWQNQTTCHVTQEKFPWKPNNKSFIDWACLVKIAWYWP